jgi:PAS domain S-box-containing protein
MEYKLAELLDVPKLQELFDSFDKLHQLPSAVIDIEGNILTATNWQDICVKFHRVNPKAEKECIKSDTYLVSELSNGRTQVEYKCPHGLVDTATPIVVDGKHLGNAFTGQFFLEPPDEGRFREQANKYGFDEEAYIEAMRQVPVITGDKHRKNLEVMAQLTEILAEMGLKQKRQLEVEQALRESKEFFKTLVEFTSGIHWELELTTNKFTYISPQIEEILGFSSERWESLEKWADTLHPDDREYAVTYCLTETQKGKDHSFEYRAIAADGATVWLHDIVKVISQGDKPVKLVGVMFDITQLKASEMEKDVLLKEVHHRVKNNMAVISSLLNMQSVYVKDSEDLEMFKESQGRIRAMALVHEKLYKTENLTHINIPEYLMSLTESIKTTFEGDTGVDVRHDIADVNLDIDILIPCGLIINELLTNSFKHAFNGKGNPEIEVRLELIDNKDIRLIISDNGAGLPEGFDVNQGTGLGLKLVTALCTQIKGSLEYQSGNGTVFTLRFPKAIPFARA